MALFDLQERSLRELNAELHRQAALLQQGADADTEWEVTNPRGSHAVAVGIDGALTVNVRGSVGYYCGGMNQSGQIHVEGSVGPGVGENMMSGSIRVTGDASQYAGATGRGGQLVIEGNASSRCGISIKGEAKLFVRGEVQSLGADCVKKEMREQHLKHLTGLLERAQISDVRAEEFTRYGSARQLYHFDVDHADAY